MNVLKKICSIYNKLEEFLLVAMIISSLSILFLNVILRKFFNSAVYGADELARVLFIWMSWLGISIGERGSEHIKIDILTSKLHGASQKVIHLLSNAITFIILLCLVRYGGAVVTQYMRMGNTTPMYKIPQWLVYGSLPFSCSVMSLRLLVNTLDIFRSDTSMEVEK